MRLISLLFCVIGQLWAACYMIWYHMNDMSAYDAEHFIFTHVLIYRLAACPVIVFSAAAVIVILLRDFMEAPTLADDRMALWLLLAGWGVMALHFTVSLLALRQVISVVWCGYWRYPALFVIPGILLGLGTDLRER